MFSPLLYIYRKVVGAGRGPLVDAALKAGVTADRKLKVFAVEKNANAVITLRNRAIMDKWTNVTIVAKDMRDWVRGKEGRGADADYLQNNRFFTRFFLFPCILPLFSAPPEDHHSGLL